MCAKIGKAPLKRFALDFASCLPIQFGAGGTVSRQRKGSRLPRLEAHPAASRRVSATEQAVGRARQGRQEDLDSRFAVSGACARQGDGGAQGGPVMDRDRNTTSGHVVMLDGPEWLAGTLMKAA
jgi:hypothetical protein